MAAPGAKRTLGALEFPSQPTTRPKQGASQNGDFYRARAGLCHGRQKSSVVSNV
jgi:hypothetical protein